MLPKTESILSQAERGGKIIIAFDPQISTPNKDHNGFYTISNRSLAEMTLWKMSTFIMWSWVQGNGLSLLAFDDQCGHQGWEVVLLKRALHNQHF